MSSNEDHKLFRNSVKGTQPLLQDKIALRQAKKFKTPSSTLTNKTTQYEYADPLHFEPVGTEDLLYYTHPHIPPKQIRRLRQGKLPIQATLDLHGMTLSQANATIESFFHRCQQQGKRFILLIHGKGGRNLLNKATLKSFVCHKLKQDPRILAFCSAKPHHGGTGALYVLIKNT